MKLFAFLFLVFLAATSMASAGTLAQFRTRFGDIDVELYDQDKPATVQNFVRYVRAGRYTNMFCHRYLPGFVMQGGGYFITTGTNGSPQFTEVPKFPAVTNEFNVGSRFSNIFGTIAMAKAANDPNSATAEWFFNLGDNSANLDVQNGGFTVFGRVLGGTTVLNHFTNLYIINIGSPFDSLPIVRTNATLDDLVYMDVSLLQVRVAATAGNAREISWTSVSNKLNSVEFTTNFPPVWQSLSVTNGTGETFKFVDSSNTNAQRFYRVRVDY